MTPDEYCQEKAAPRGSSIHYSLLSLRPEQRRALTALHAFYRETLEIVDECEDTQVARAKLGWWREETRRLFTGQAQHPIARALAACLECFNLSQEPFQELIDGIEMNLDYDAYPSFAELTLYCHRVGGVPGLLATEILGYQDSHTSGFGHELGIALLLVRILRDVRVDVRKERFYIPEDELRQFGVSHGDLLQRQTSERVRELFKFQADRIRDYRQRAFERLPEQDRYRQRSNIILAEIAMDLLSAIETDNFRILEQRISLTALRKFWIAWRTLRRERRRHRLR